MKDYNDELLELMKDELVEIISSDEYYKDFHFILTNEQQFVKNSDRKPHCIYIVVKFLEGTPFLGQNILPINVNAIGEENGIEACQRLLTEFAQAYNLKTTNSSTESTTIFKQFYSTPQVINNFNEVWVGFRTLFYLSGTFLIGEKSNPISEVTVNGMTEDGEIYKIKFLSCQFSYDNQLDPQAYTGTNSRTKSIAKIATLSISFSLYLTNDEFCNTILGMGFNNTTLAPNGNKTTFSFNIKFASGLEVNNMTFKLANVSGQQNVGEFPLISVSFTN